MSHQGFWKCLLPWNEPQVHWAEIVIVWGLGALVVSVILYFW